MQLTGRSMTDHIVVFDGTDRLIGQTVRVKVDDASPFTLYGIVETEQVVGVDLASGGRQPPEKTPTHQTRDRSLGGLTPPARLGRVSLPLA